MMHGKKVLLNNDFNLGPQTLMAVVLKLWLLHGIPRKLRVIDLYSFIS